ncbi:MAG: TolC family protein [Acidobacteriota bacterium]|nr:TolC family protein [Acidobacteriota bacterium]
MRRNFGRVLLFAALLFTGVIAAVAQQAQSPLRLSLRDAIDRGLRANLGVLLSRADMLDADGERIRSRAALLPKVDGGISPAVQSRNLHSFGLSFPGVPEVVGPYSTYDFRTYFSQPVINIESYRKWKSSEKREQAARLDYQDVRDSVVRQVAAIYLNAEAAAAQTKAAESRVRTAQALYDLAQKQHDAGVATGVDVLRARVTLANEEQVLLEDRNAARQALLSLARSIGLDPSTQIELSEVLSYRPLAPPAIGPAVSGALLARADYLALAKQRQALVDEQQANRARYLPSLSIDGDYGGIGRTLGQVRQTMLVAGTLHITLFNQDREGEREQVDSRIDSIDARIADLRRGIEEQIRSALLNLETAAETVDVARQGEDLAQRELKLARDRFRSGVTDNIEVITAQDALARAQENYISALTQHEDAKISLARALGGTEKTYERYLGIP